MKLIPCENCGVIIDLDNRAFPETMYNEDGDIDDTKAAYSHWEGEYVPYITCPVCDNKILKEGKI